MRVLTLPLIVITLLAFSCSSFLDYKMCDAIAEGDFQKAQTYIDEGANINRRFSEADGYTCLMAASSAPPEGVRLLLQNGADPNIAAPNGRTALMVAVANGRLENVRLLLEHGANPNAVAKDGVTALSWAIEKDHTKIVQLLQEYGAH